ncbi:MAG: DUF998 domain-containing protein [Christensenellales bacterium]|jgi:hypothetical membrane protein
MTRVKNTAGILGIAGMCILLIAIIVSIIGYEDGPYSLSNCFVSELGLYTSGYMTISYALIFNIGMIVSGLLFAAFMVTQGIKENTQIHTVIGFFGTLTGVLIAAQGVFTLNYVQYHYIVTTAFFVSSFVMCALYVVSQIMNTNRGKLSFTNMIVAFFAGVISAVYTGFMLTDGMAQVLAQDAAKISRPSFMPFSVVEWIAYLLVMAFFTILAVEMLLFSHRLINADVHNKLPKLKNSPIAVKVRPSYIKDKSDTRNIEL